jgi:methyl-accepting chemotaxis protein
VVDLSPQAFRRLYGRSFSNIIINNMILPLKEKLNMYDIRAGEKDFFLRNREMINVIGIIYLLGAYLSFIAFTYTQYDFGGMDFDPFQVVLGTIGFLGLLIILQVYLSTISNRTQLNKLSHGLESLLLKQSDGEQQIQLLNFDQTGGVISLFNKVLQKSQKEAKILGLIQDELLDNLSKIQIATGNMNDIVVQQQKNTQKVNAEKFQLEESMANLEEILHRQNETLEVALTHTHDIASAGRKTLLENENLRRNTQESHQKAEKQIAGSQMRMEKTKELSSRVMGITAQMDEAKLKSAKVNGILAEIEEVAEKTHVLAINASIESAHSGTYGKGFAIIAGEVRKVAEGTAEAVRQTAGILNEMQQAVGEASDFAQEVHDMVQETRDDSQAVQLTLGELSRVFQQNNQGIQGIAELTNSQNEISKKLEEKMDGLGNMSQETAKALRRQTMSKDRLDIVIDELDQSTEDGVKQIPS